MKTSSISHPANNSFLIIHNWQMKAAAENPCAAALISYFESILNHNNNVSDFHAKFDEKAERAALLVSESGIPCKLSSLRLEIMSFWGEKKISESLHLLEQIGFISLLDASDPFKRTKYIRFHPEACNKWIRANYDGLGSYVGIQDETRAKKTMPVRSCEDISSKKPKGVSIIDEQNDTNYSLNNIHNSESLSGSTNANASFHQPQEVDYPDNAKMPPRKNSKDFSLQSKGVLNINQLKNSINFNQADLKNNSVLKSRVKGRDDRTKNEIDHPIVNTLVKAGLAAEKFEYPDVLPSIMELQGKGATVETYTKAYDKACRVNNGKGFGIKYLNKVVEGILQKECKVLSTQNKSERTHYKSGKSKEYKYENDLNKAMQWASDYLTSDIEGK
jgi:hypothetical protein